MGLVVRGLAILRFRMALGCVSGGRDGRKVCDIGRCRGRGRRAAVHSSGRDWQSTVGQKGGEVISIPMNERKGAENKGQKSKLLAKSRGREKKKR